MYLRVATRLGTYRSFHMTIAIISAVHALLLSVGIGPPYRLSVVHQFFCVCFLGIDALIRLWCFGNQGLIRSVDYLFTSILVNVGVLDLVFPSFEVVDLPALLSLAFAMRASVAGLDWMTVSKRATVPAFRKLVVETQKGNMSASLGICFISPRIVVVTKAFGNHKREYRFLEDKFSAFLRSFEYSKRNCVQSFSVLVNDIHAVYTHLLSNPVNVVCFRSGRGETYPLMVLAGLIVRTEGSSAIHALSVITSSLFDIPPASLIHNSQIRQLMIYEKLMLRRELSAPLRSDMKYFLKRVVLSQFDAEAFQDLSLDIVDVGNSCVVATNMHPAGSIVSLTFTVNAIVGSEAYFVLFSAKGKEIGLYMHGNNHLDKMIAQTACMHFVGYSDKDCDSFGSRLAELSVRIEVVASTDLPEGSDRGTATSHVGDLLDLPASQGSEGTV